MIAAYPGPAQTFASRSIIRPRRMTKSTLPNTARSRRGSADTAIRSASLPDGQSGVAGTGQNGRIGPEFPCEEFDLHKVARAVRRKAIADRVGPRRVADAGIDPGFQRA